ncbi:uncharacterized protein LOC110990563 isoform X2 [Acanthaster planci]|nr:uncharacterized protein LOC110990563 isoform X2 [Acanthaster planci]XP_022111309.1 uncharacterized protein LOC110990563 isoform X2 [Acanthaster planci]
MAPITSPDELAGIVVLALCAGGLILLSWLFMLKHGSQESSDEESGGFELTDLKLRELSRQISTKWIDLALRLGYTHSEIKIFQADNKNDTTAQCWEMLVAWRRKHSDEEKATEKLKRALVGVELQEVVQKMGNTGEQTGSGE